MKHIHFIKNMGAGCLFLVLVFCTGAFADMKKGASDINKGPEEIVLNAGKQGDVFFPHRRHQNMAPNNCRTCHDLFPEVKGSIEQKKKEGAFKARQVMNGLCIACHRKTALAGKPAGPRSCTGCHRKHEPVLSDRNKTAG